MTSDTLVLLIGESVSTIVEEGGTSAWHISPANAAKCEYVVCTRNARATWGDKREAHGTAFLIGRIKEIVPSRAALGNPQILKDRFSIVISQYCELHQENVWRSGGKNPVRYSSLSEIHIDPSTCHWNDLPNEPMRPVKSRK